MIKNYYRHNFINYYFDYCSKIAHDAGDNVFCEKCYFDGEMKTDAETKVISFFLEPFNLVDFQV